MTKLFLITALMTLSFAAIAAENAPAGDTPDERCDVAVNGSEVRQPVTSPGGNGGGATRGGAQSE